MGLVGGLIVGLWAGTSLAEEAIPGRVLIDQDNNISEDQEWALVQDLRAEFPEIQLTPSGLEKQTKIEVATVNPENTERLVNFLKHRAGVHQVELSYPVRAYWEPNDPDYSKQWGMKSVNAPSAWGYSQGQGAVVAVIDTGVACEDREGFTRLSDLKDSHCLPGWNFVADNDLAADDQGHGSHVAGTIAQSTNNGVGVAGVAFKASILPIKVLDRNGSGTAEDVADGIRWAADHGAQVINMSLGSDHPSGIEKEAIEYAHAKGVVVIAAAGNSGGSVGYPAAFDNVVAVSAIDSSGTITSFSSRGPQVDIAAPGKDILQQTICDHGANGCEQYGSFSGTSMATPHVAGVAALLVSAGVSDPDQVEKILKENATQTKTTSGRPKEYGAGLLNAAAAVKNVVWKQGLTRLGIGLAWLYLLLSVALKGKEHLSVKNWKFLVPAGLSGVGLFFLPMIMPMIGPMFYLTRPMLELDRVVSGSWHQYLPLATGLVPAGLTVVAYHHSYLRQAVAGLASGVGVYLLSVVYLGQHFNPWGIWFTGWMMVNAAACGIIAKLNLEKVKDEHADSNLT